MIAGVIDEDKSGDVTEGDTVTWGTYPDLLGEQVALYGHSDSIITEVDSFGGNTMLRVTTHDDSAEFGTFVDADSFQFEDKIEKVEYDSDADGPGLLSLIVRK